MTLIGQQTESLCHLIKDAEYDEQLKLISKNYNRFDELDSAIDWALARFNRNPSVFYELEEKNHFIWKTDKVLNFPKLRILFRYDEGIKTINLLFVEEIDGL